MISIHNPAISQKEIDYVTDAITNGWRDKCYDYIYRFEKQFAAYIGTRYAMATSSATGAITVALSAMGVQPGDEIVMAEIDWVASVSAIHQLGATPVFIDVLEDSWCMDTSKLEAAITPKTKAIIAVHVYGNLVEMDKVMAIAKKYNLPVLEDAAEAIGSEWKGKKAGSYGDIAVFSFHGAKTMTTGEGGMLVTSNTYYFDRVKILNNHGRDPKKSNGDPGTNRVFWMDELGFKFKMSNIQAALGCAQIERIEEIVAQKRLVFQWYQEFLQNVTGVSLNAEPADAINSYWMPTVVFDKSLDIDAHQVIEFLKEKDIESRPFFFPLSSLPMFEDIPENTVAYGLHRRALNLPSNFALTRAEVKTVCNAIEDYLQLQQVPALQMAF